MKRYLKISALNLHRLGNGRRLPGSNYIGVTRLGHIDRVSEGKIVGWVKDETDDTPLTIDIFLNGEKIETEIVSNRHRQDVQDAGFGTGCFGFECALPESCLQLCEGSVVEAKRSSSGEVLLRHVVLPPRLTHSVPEEAAALPTVTERSEEGRSGPELSIKAVSFECEAKIESVSLTELRGWAINRNALGQIFDIEVLIDGQLFCTTRNEHSRRDLLKHGKSQGLGGVRLPMPFRRLEAGEHTVSLRLPDGSSCSETVFVAESPQRYPLSEGVATISLADVAVIVPVYNAAEDVAVCIERLAEFTPPEVEILFVDDASPDRTISALMHRAAAQPNMRVLKNSENMGFTRTVNRGLAEIGCKHAILLNSDARVTPGWVQGMLMAAESRPRVATVTAMSDRAGAFSAPALGNSNELPPGVDEITYARAFRRRALGLYPVVPTGNGFCMFVNRACIDEIGPLDADAFPRGYGEENDFCMRAGRAGWTHLVDDRTYVFHDRSKSFASPDRPAPG